MTTKMIVAMQGGSVVLSKEILAQAGIRIGEAVVCYQMGDELHIRKCRAEEVEMAAGQ
jgi:hypothetical protein